MLLLVVFTVVNVAVLVLRRDPVDHEHFHAPSVFPVLGSIVAVALLIDTAGDDPAVLLRAGLLLVLGAFLWLVHRLLAGPQEEIEAERLRG